MMSNSGRVSRTAFGVEAVRLYNGFCAKYDSVGRNFNRSTQVAQLQAAVKADEAIPTSRNAFDSVRKSGCPDL